MSKEIDIQKRCFCLRNGNEIWVSETAYQNYKRVLNEANGHATIYISEIDKDINSADVVETCTPSQMEDKRRIDRGDRKCAYGKWHKKREVCDCYSRSQEKKRERLRKNQEAEENKPISEEQRKINKNNLDKIGKDLVKKGIIKPNKKTIQEIHQEETDSGIQYADDIQYSKNGNCIVCEEPLPKGCANVCSGGCASERDKDPERYKNKLKKS